MKKPTVWLALLCILILSWLLLRQDHPNNSSPASGSEKTPTGNEPLLPSTPANPRAAHPESLAKFKNAFSSTINLHGKVVDQNGNPVPGAIIKFSIQGFSEKAKSHVVSDSDGLFLITGYQGGTMSVEVTKAGFRQLPYSEDGKTSAIMLYYGLGTQRENSPNKPMIFTLQKSGMIEPLVHAEERNYRLPRDGSPTEIDLNPGGAGAHRAVLRCWNKELDPRTQSERRYDWSLEIVVPKGGIIERKDMMAYEAPSDGYMPKARIEMPVDAKPIWSRSAQRSYFIRFADNVFARVNLRMHAGGDHFVVWESHLNPKSGSRNLEDAPPN